jgi:hypothetical protein
MVQLRKPHPSGGVMDAPAVLVVLVAAADAVVVAADMEFLAGTVTAVVVAAVVVAAAAAATLLAPVAMEAALRMLAADALAAWATASPVATAPAMVRTQTTSAIGPSRQRLTVTVRQCIRNPLPQRFRQ